MPPNKLGNNFKTIKITCKQGHEVAKYRKPKTEWGERTHKLWLIPERLGELCTEPPILQGDPKTREEKLVIPPTDTEIHCGDPRCNLVVGHIAMVGGTVALKLAENNLKPTKG